eukprot:Nk52_evm15s208 gene=Nk52_evmTU15s208
MLNLIRKGARYFHTHPLTANTASAVLLGGVGDVIEQKVIQRRPDWDHWRTVRMGSIGVVLGPLGHYWYMGLDKMLTTTISARVISKKVLLDQCIMAPSCIFVFYTGLNYLETRNMKDALAEFRLKFWDTWMMDWKVWPAAQTINFYLVPRPYRVLFVNVMTLLMDIYLSGMKNRYEAYKDL